jgi:diadenosine tetraphosphate (Ap4A) HIT family hydrolase
MLDLPETPKESIIYDDPKLYCCLASYPLTNGHTVIVWKAPVKDLHLLSRSDYLYLMEKVDLVRNALLKALTLEKVYLIYMDEVNQVHWHLVPRYNERGFNMLNHAPTKITDFSLAHKIKVELNNLI